MQGYLLDLEKEALAAIGEAKSKRDLEELRTKYLGRKQGLITKVIKDLPALTSEEKRITGPLANQVKRAIEEALDSGKEVPIGETRRDLTAPGKSFPVGKLHPVTLAIIEILSIFKDLGFSIYGPGPEIDWFWYAFEALNMPDTHPAADDFETYFIDTPPDPQLGKMVLRPHTSSVQTRIMKEHRPPYRVLIAGKTYRPNVSARHTPMFHQFEGVVVEKSASIGNLKAVLNYFVQRYFGPEIKVRLRPHHFNFTEPSFEVDITCTVCKGRGCVLCKSLGWLELGGAGMVHPNVLKAGGLDPKAWSGYAWGWGIERCLAIKYQIPDIRVLYDNDLRALGSIS
jgi:phenylalanyl-tRNA synthetase alpha chain